VGIVDAIHQTVTLIFLLGSGLVGVKLLLLARRTRQLPELLLGGSILGTGALGYGFLIAAMVIRGLDPIAPELVPRSVVVLSAISRTIHDIGVMLYLTFIVYVFRRSSPWAYALAITLAVLLWGGFLVGAAHGSLRSLEAGGLSWYCEYGVVWVYPLWTAIEAFRYWGLMRRRVALGLADPLVANRFWLWGTGAVLTALAIWIASIPFVFPTSPAVVAWTPTIRILTAFSGLASVSCALLAFLPPAWYRRRFEARSPAGALTATR